MNKTENNAFIHQVTNSHLQLFMKLQKISPFDFNDRLYLVHWNYQFNGSTGPFEREKKEQVIFSFR